MDNWEQGREREEDGFVFYRSHLTVLRACSQFSAIKWEMVALSGGAQRLGMWCHRLSQGLLHAMCKIQHFWGGGHTCMCPGVTPATCEASTLPAAVLRSPSSSFPDQEVIICLSPTKSMLFQETREGEKSGL